MKIVVRKYTGNGAADLMDLIAKNAADVKRVIGAVPGFVSYNLGKTSDGGFSVTVCKDQAGIDASVAAAREWVVKNASHLKVAPPAVTVADGTVQF